MDTLVLLSSRAFSLLPADEMPEITPDFGFPGSTLLNQVVSWTLGGGLLLGFLALIVLLLLIVFKGFGNQGIQQKASGIILWVFIGLVCLGSVTLLYDFIIGLDLGL
ncbi:hypothetical protein [Leucobacter chinensis]|uniref:hypothetical protein n=1 Tax=Leucobacter chinensis TaxID=2851010 RepID=UPI001C22AC38|nr:hypothetical protein [Leucobacter chinensis]